MSLLKSLAIRISKYGLVQRFLARNIEVSQYLTGIGSGDFVESSGERAVIELLRRNSRPPYCIFDVGANEGHYTEMITTGLSGVPFAIHAFEPCLYTFDLLQKNIPTGGTLKLNNQALGSERGTATLYYNQPGSVMASMTKRNIDHYNIEFDCSETIEVTTVDQYCAENGIEHIHLLKLDVEGHEMDVLAGAEGMFSRDAIDMVTFEFNACNIDTHTYFRDFYHFFEGVGLGISRITPSGYLQPINEYTEILEQFRTTNFVAMKG